MYIKYFSLDCRVIDLQIIEDKADNDEYKNVEEFRADILTLVHNIIIFHGGKMLNYTYFFLINLNIF